MCAVFKRWEWPPTSGHTFIYYYKNLKKIKSKMGTLLLNIDTISWHKILCFIGVSIFSYIPYYCPVFGVSLVWALFAWNTAPMQSRPAYASADPMSLHTTSSLTVQTVHWTDKTLFVYPLRFYFFNFDWHFFFTCLHVCCSKPIPIPLRKLRGAKNVPIHKNWIYFSFLFFLPRPTSRLLNFDFHWIANIIFISTEDGGRLKIQFFLFLAQIRHF